MVDTESLNSIMTTNLQNCHTFAWSVPWVECHVFQISTLNPTHVMSHFRMVSNMGRMSRVSNIHTQSHTCYVTISHGQYHG